METKGDEKESTMLIGFGHVSKKEARSIQSDEAAGYYWCTGAGWVDVPDLLKHFANHGVPDGTFGPFETNKECVADALSWFVNGLLNGDEWPDELFTAVENVFGVKLWRDG